MIENRQYYDVYFPEQSVSVGSRYFFFKSLADTELGNAVNNILSSNLNKITPKNDEGLQIIEGAMAFLEKMIESEQANEKEYYTINIVNNNKMPESIRKECETLFSSTSLDYIKFINLINTYYDGIENYKKNLEYESTRLHKLERLYDEFHKHYTQNEDGTYTISKYNKETQKIEESNSSFYVAFRQFLLEGAHADKNWISKADQQFGFNTKTMANTIQNQFQSIYNKIWNNTDFRTQIENALPTGLKNYKEQVTVYLIEQVLQESSGMLADFFDNKEFKVTLAAKDVDAFVRQFLNKLDIQPGATTSEKLESIILTNLKGEAEELVSAEYRISNASDRIIKNVKNDIEVSLGDDGHSINNLSQDIINLVQTRLAQLKKHTTVSDKKVWNKNEMFQALSEVYRDKPIRIKAKKWNQAEIVPLINELIKNQSLAKIKIAAKDNIISEGWSQTNLQRAPTLLGRIKNIFMTFGTQKADVAGIELGQVNISPEHIPWDKISQKIVDNYLQSLEILDIDINSKNMKFNEKTFRQNNKFGAKEFSIEAETLRRLAIKEKQIEDIQSILKRKGAKADEIATVLDSLKESVQIGSTVKSYNKYDNKEGFHGGSLGGSVETQLANIYKMFEYGGVTMPDIKWLTFAVYNAGPGLLGNHLKEPIEDILSTVAVMLMFDDAGQQAAYLNEQIKQRYNLSQYNNAKFLHLYYLNGTYYPSSFVLQLTYNGLLKAYTELNHEYLRGTEAFNSVSNGSRATIINPVSERNEIGTRTNNDIVTTKQEQWAATFNANSKSVKIQVTFLAGVLDIIDILNKSMM